MNLSGRGRKGDSYSPYKSRKFLLKNFKLFHGLYNSVLISIRDRNYCAASISSFHSTSSGINRKCNVNSYHYKRNHLQKRARTVAAFPTFIYLEYVENIACIRHSRFFAYVSTCHRQNNELIPSDERNSRTKISSTSEASQCFQPRRKRLSISLDPKR